MSPRSIAIALLLWLGLGTAGAIAQGAKKNAATGSIAAGADQGLSKKQIEAVRKVSTYFNQLTIIKGMFLQTSADNQRLRGHYYIARPGRFRFEFNRPSRVVILSDGRYVAIQDHDLNTDDRWDLTYTPFRALLQREVDLLRDTRIFEVLEEESSIVVTFEDQSSDTAGRIKLFMASKPAMQIKAWITKDAQGLDTRVDLTDVQPSEEPDPKLFDPALKAGVVVLWNSASSRPNGIEYEVMDMVYHLPFHDWLSLDSREGAAAPEPESEEGTASPRERAALREEEKGRRRPGR